ncbi:Asialoglycoprotein receptor 2 [Triplophysa tibetana]|uniref:Asialoglycoprotein receptor 2 n=1 Tax=Triplophysa tibetana TaxID=1572043 RepID=A0A5A9N027_9TELE|nr:Asialoglycoprotein receptor 2 [Triplophysa tibetana]
MEDEVCYSTVTFKSFDNDKTKAQQLPGKESGLPPQDQQSEDYNHMTDSKNILTLYNEERTDNQQLLTHKELLEREIKGLSTQNEELNSNLNFILKQSTLSIEDYCQSTEKGVRCKPCPKNWIQNGSSCYHFHVESDWKTWGDSNKSCTTSGAHLAIIDSVEEQEFVNKHVEFYYDIYHGYWIGPWNWTSEAELKKG